jgi:hypothetical protein
MEPASQYIFCPKNPDHGMTTKRWLHHDDREMITRNDEDVFEIDCPICGKYEYREDLSVMIRRQANGGAGSLTTSAQ